MEEPPDLDGVEAAAELVLLQGSLQSVEAKVERVCGDLAETRRHLEEVVRLTEDVLAQVRPPNPVGADAEAIHAQARALLTLPSLALLDR